MTNNYVITFFTSSLLYLLSFYSTLAWQGTTMYSCMFLNAWIVIYVYACMHVCMYACVYVYMYVCRLFLFHKCCKVLECVSIRQAMVCGRPVSQNALIKFVRNCPRTMKWFHSGLTKENMTMLQKERPSIELLNWKTERKMSDFVGNVEMG